LVNLLILSLLIRSVSTLLSLLVEDAAADAIHRSELPSPNSSLIETRPQIIPKIIHQTYKNETIPEVWLEAQKSCIDLHPDYEYIVRFFALEITDKETGVLTMTLALDQREVARFHRC
jgi:mannosyltransferase OCH1-like enzyme